MIKGKLTTLRKHLVALRRRRRLLRWGLAASGLALAAVWILIVAFLVDWTWEPSVPYRVASLAACAIALIWAFRRLALPWLGHRETDLDMALLVEREQQIDSDLVAALQFESPQASGWGSAQLESAVVEYVADFGRQLNVFANFSWRPAARRVVALGATVSVVGVLALVFSGHAVAFFNRFLLGSQHYPTRTRIERLLVSGREIDPTAAPSGPLKVPYGHPLEFEVHASGELPEQGHVRLTTLISGTETEVLLNSAVDQPQVYAGNFERLVDSIEFDLHLGDAWTEPLRLLAIPLPVVSLTLEPTPPEYAAGSEPPVSEGERQIAVVEGSRVGVELKSDKPLETATLSIAGLHYPLSSIGDDRRTWRLPEGNCPLDQVTAALSYEVQVRDLDGLELPEPIRGSLRIKADRLPRVTGALVTAEVLPTAKPSLSFGATDDYGIAGLRLLRTVERSDGTTLEDACDVPFEQPSGVPTQLLVQGRLTVDLAPLKLVKGDKLKLVLEASDFRGTLPSRTAQSAPLELQVTDERGVLAGMAKADERSAKQLDAIIQRQLGIGETK